MRRNCQDPQVGKFGRAVRGPRLWPIPVSFAGGPLRQFWHPFDRRIPRNLEDFMNHKNAPLLSCLMLWLSASCTLAQSERNVPAKDLVTKSVNAIGFPVGGGDV